MRALCCSARCRPTVSQVAVNQRRKIVWGISKMGPVGVAGDARQHIDLVADAGTHCTGAATYASRLPDNSALAALSTEQKQQIISDAIRGIPDFPKPGILFWDVTTLLLNPQAFQLAIDLLVERYKEQKIDVVAGFEARGLIFGAPLALALGCAFVPLRKPGKLPGETISESYITEYSTDSIEMHTGAVQAGQRVLLVDDLIATGGTLRAGINLMGKVGAEVVESACVIELPALKGRDKLGDNKLFVLIEKEGE